MATENKGSASLRAMIQEAVAEDATLERVRQLIADVFDTTKARKIECPECHVEFRAALPDVKAQVDTMVSLLEEAEGRAAQQPVGELTIIIERPPR